MNPFKKTKAVKPSDLPAHQKKKRLEKRRPDRGAARLPSRVYANNYPPPLPFPFPLSKLHCTSKKKTERGVNQI